MWPFPFRNKVASVHCSLILLQGINLPHGELSFSTPRPSSVWMRAVTALQPSPASFFSWAFTSPMFWENEPVSLIQLSSHFEQAAASLAFLGVIFTGRNCHSLYQVGIGSKCLSHRLTEARLYKGFQGIKKNHIIFEVFCLCHPNITHKLLLH